MPIIYKVNVLDELKDRGYSTARIRKEKLIAESVVQHLRTGGGISFASLAQLCELLKCQPGDILEYTKDDSKPSVPRPRRKRSVFEEHMYIASVWYDKYRKDGETLVDLDFNAYRFLLPVPDDWELKK